VGTAMSIATSIQMVGVGLGNLLVGVIVKDLGYTGLCSPPLHPRLLRTTDVIMLLRLCGPFAGVMIFFTCMSGFASLLVALVNIIDRRFNAGKLNYHIAGKPTPAPPDKTPEPHLGAEVTPRPRGESDLANG